jgi:hypothetical protein
MFLLIDFNSPIIAAKSPPFRAAFRVSCSSLIQHDRSQGARLMPDLKFLFFRIVCGRARSNNVGICTSSDCKN